MSPRRRAWLAAVGGAGLATFAFAGYRRRVSHLFRRQDSRRTRQLNWQDCGPTPLADQGYKPQGIASLRQGIALSVTRDNVPSKVFLISVDSGRVLWHLDMPPEATHTSGLTWSGPYLWAVDYNSRVCYRIDLDASRQTGRAMVSASFQTLIDGVSACCMVEYKGHSLLAISQFGRERKTVFVDPEQALRNGSVERYALQYENEGFSQGLTFDGIDLYESENKLGRNVVNRLNLDLLERTHSAYSSTVEQYNAPGNAVEDLAWDGVYLWTTDEWNCRLYRAALRVAGAAR